MWTIAPYLLWMGLVKSFFGFDDLRLLVHLGIGNPKYRPHQSSLHPIHVSRSNSGDAGKPFLVSETENLSSLFEWRETGGATCGQATWDFD